MENSSKIDFEDFVKHDLINDPLTLLASVLNHELMPESFRVPYKKGIVYQYNYDDWEKGNISTGSLNKLVQDGKLSYDDLEAIRLKQEHAFSYRANLIFVFLTMGFKSRYEISFAKEELVEYFLRSSEQYLNEFKANYRQVYLECLYGIDGKHELDRQALKELYLSDSLNLTKGTHLDYIVRSKWHKWLLWLKEGGPKESEPNIWLRDFNFTDETEEPIENTLYRILQSKHKTESLSYIWQNNPDDELPELYNLVKGKLIHDSTTLEQFKAVFTGKPTTVLTPIKWHDDNASELLYFIQQLEGLDGSLIEKGDRANYQRLKACFVKSDGKQFTENFRQIKQNLKAYGLAPAKQQIIDTIIKQLY